MNYIKKIILNRDVPQDETLKIKEMYKDSVVKTELGLYILTEYSQIEQLKNEIMSSDLMCLFIKDKTYYLTRDGEEICIRKPKDSSIYMYGADWDILIKKLKLHDKWRVR